MRFVSFAFPLCCFGDGQLWQNGLLDDPGLLQVQTRLISNVPVADPISLSTLEAMDTLVNKMSLGDPSQAEIDLVTGLITTLDDEFKTKLVTDSQKDLLAHSAIITAHNECKGQRDLRFDTVTGDVGKLSLAFIEKRSKHAGCRKATKSYSVFETDLDQVAVGTWPTLAGVTGETQVGALPTLCTSRTAFVDDVDSYKILPPSGVSANCALDQTSFEEEFCTWVSSKTSACLACDECVTQVGAAAFKASILTRDASRRATYQTIMKLQCRLQHLADAYTSGDSSDSADADTCGDALLPDVTHYGYDVLVTPITIPSCLSDADITNPVMPSTETASSGYEMMGELGCSGRNELGSQNCPVGQDCVDWAKSVCDENESCISFEYIPKDSGDRCRFSTTCTADIATYYSGLGFYVKRLSGKARCTAWKNQEYSWTSERTAVTECRATCQIGSVTVSVEGCVDIDHDLCPFYSLHHDACAAYNDDAQSKCCACGGGTRAIPPCAWKNNDGQCPGFSKDGFVVGLLGVDGCPPGSVVISDDPRCKIAATAFGAPYDKDDRADGGECFWWGGSRRRRQAAGGGRRRRSPFRVNERHGSKAKWICEFPVVPAATYSRSAGVCRMASGAYGGYCQGNDFVGSNPDCENLCSGYAWCRGMYTVDGKCRLFSLVNELPPDCPSGFSSFLYTGSKVVEGLYTGDGSLNSVCSAKQELGAACSTEGWTNIKKDCGECKVLAQNMATSGQYSGKCSEFCAAQSRSCVKAEEEVDDSCTSEAEWDCETSVGRKSSPDILCTCGDILA